MEHQRFSIICGGFHDSSRYNSVRNMMHVVDKVTGSVCFKEGLDFAYIIYVAEDKSVIVTKHCNCPGVTTGDYTKVSSNIKIAQLVFSTVLEFALWAKTAQKTGVIVNFMLEDTIGPVLDLVGVPNTFVDQTVLANRCLLLPYLTQRITSNYQKYLDTYGIKLVPFVIVDRSSRIYETFTSNLLDVFRDKFGSYADSSGFLYVNLNISEYTVGKSTITHRVNLNDVSTLKKLVRDINDLRRYSDNLVVTPYIAEVGSTSSYTLTVIDPVTKLMDTSCISYKESNVEKSSEGQLFDKLALSVTSTLISNTLTSIGILRYDYIIDEKDTIHLKHIECNVPLHSTSEVLPYMEAYFGKNYMSSYIKAVIEANSLLLDRPTNND